jgi:nicotinamide-nucleotide amidase
LRSGLPVGGPLFFSKLGIMNFEIISIGDELLIGQTINTNAAWMSEQALIAGLQCTRVHTIGDDPQVLQQVLDEVLGRVELVWITGGLGPTQDDRTKDALVAYVGCEMELHVPTLERIEAYFASRGLPMLEINRMQAMLPTGPGTQLLPNPRGTAAGMWLETARGQVLVALPGVPSEMKGLVEEEVLPRVHARWQLPRRPQRTVRVHGMGESYISDRLGDWESQLAIRGVAMAYLPHLGSVRVRFSTGPAEGEGAEALLEVVCQEFADRLGEVVYALEDVPLAQVVGEGLLARGQTVGVVESCTGGALAAAFTAIPGASRYFMGGIVAYDAGGKSRWLGVDPALIRGEGTVSEAVAAALASGGRERLGVDWCVATTGVAGPTPADGGEGRPQVAVGTLYIAIAGPGLRTPRVFMVQSSPRQSRAQLIERWVLEAMNRLRLEICR